MVILKDFWVIVNSFLCSPLCVSNFTGSGRRKEIAKKVVERLLSNLQMEDRGPLLLHLLQQPLRLETKTAMDEVVVYDNTENSGV